jgi:excisionase family DNA binding protein
MRDLSPREVARSLGVSESSVKRWVDDGTLAAQRTAGGHRRIPVGEVVRFVRRSGSAVVQPEIIFGTGMATAVAPFDHAASEEMGRRLYSLLQHDNAPAVRALLLALYAAGWPVAALCDGPIRLALTEIGTLWHHGVEGIITEHRATETCIRVLAEIRTLFAAPADDAPTALGAAPSGDPYLLPSMMAAAVLADLGYRDHNLGPDLPTTAMLKAVDHYRPRLVWLAMSVSRADERLTPAETELAARLERQGATLIVGGRGAPPAIPIAGVLRIHSMAELAAFARGARLASEGMAS